MRKQRIISLLPSATEMVCALGAASRLVGRSHECDFPPEISSLAACTSANLDPQTSSAEIDRQVKNLVSDSLAIYQIDTAKLKDLKPDLILTQAQCEVCAVSLPEVEQAVADWTGRRPEILSLSPVRLADIWADFTRVAQALDLEAHGRDVLRGLKTRMVNIIEKSCLVNPRPSVACIEWIEPLMAAGNWIPELVELAGGADVLGQAGQHSDWVQWETLRDRDPEIIIALPCGFDLARTRSEMSALTRHPDWPKLRAVKNHRIFVTDGNQYFNRPGPRIVESLEILAEIIHPDRFHFNHRGKAWDKLK